MLITIGSSKSLPKMRTTTQPAAVPTLKKVITKKPHLLSKRPCSFSHNSDSVLGRFAWFRAACPDESLRDGKAAIRMSMRACELSKWEDSPDIEALAAAYAETGDFDKAVKFQTQAINMKSGYGHVFSKKRVNASPFTETTSLGAANH